MVVWGVCPGRAGGLIPCSVEDDPVALSFVIIPAVFEDVLVVSGVPPPPATPVPFCCVCMRVSFTGAVWGALGAQDSRCDPLPGAAI